MSANTTTLARGVAQGATANPANFAAGNSNAGSASQEGASGEPHAAGKEGEQFGIGREELEALKKQAAGQSSLLRRLTNELDSLRKRLGNEAEGENDGQEEGKPKQYRSPYMKQLAELNEFKTKIEAERADLLQSSALQGIYNTLVVKGVEPKLAGMVADSLKHRVAGKLASNKDALGRTVLEIRGTSQEEAPTSLDDWMEAWMQSDEGKALNPPEPNPNLRGVPVRRGSAPEAKIRVTRSDLLSGRVSLDDISAGKVIVTDAQE